MPESYIINKDSLTAIADGFRESRGLSGKLTTADMAELARTSGGSSGDGSPRVIDRVVNLAAAVEVTNKELCANPIIDISMVDGSNLGIGGSGYAATNNGGSFANGKFVIDGSGFLTVPTDFMAGTEPWTVAFTIDAYTVASTTYSRVARGNNDVPCIFYTKSINAFQVKLAQKSANTEYVEVRDSSFISVASNGAISFTFPSDGPTTFVFRNDGEYVTFWVNGKERLREAASRYTSDKYASTFSIGDDALAGSNMIHMECSMLNAWNRALTDEEIVVL